MESRKYQLQKQIINALKNNDDDLYSLLKSQWAHRFGVESLEELKSLDLNELNQSPTNVDNQKIDQSQENSFESDKAFSIKVEDSQEEEIKNKELESIMEENQQDSKVESYEIVDKESIDKRAINSVKDNKSISEIKALIPLPPKPKYSYLKKWLLRK